MTEELRCPKERLVNKIPKVRNSEKYIIGPSQNLLAAALDDGMIFQSLPMKKTYQKKTYHGKTLIQVGHRPLYSLKKSHMQK